MIAHKRAFEYTAITIGPFLFSTIEKLNIFYIRYDDGVGNNGSNGNYTVTMVIASSSKTNIFFLCCIFVNVIWQIITMVLTSKQREKLVLDLYNEGKTIKEIAKEAKMSFRDIGYILKAGNRKNRQMQSISSQAYKLFSEGKIVLQVAIALSLRDHEVSALYTEYCNLSGLDSLCVVYREVKD